MNEQERDQEWLGKVRVVDLVDMSYGTFDLSQGSTEERWNSTKEKPMTFLELEKFSDEDLANELKRRGKLVPVLKPAPINRDVPKQLLEICENYLDEAWYKDYIDEDLPHYIFETAMTSVFGEEIFEKIRTHRSVK